MNVKANSTGFKSAKKGGASPMVLPLAMANHHFSAVIIPVSEHVQVRDKSPTISRFKHGSFITWIIEKQSLQDRKPLFSSLSQTTKVARGDNKRWSNLSHSGAV